MKNILRLQKNILVIMAIVLSYSAKAQDIRFTQAFANPLNLNPAMMGLNPDLMFALQHRNQWGNISNGYSTSSFSMFLPIYSKADGTEKIDLGFNAMNNVAGAFNTLHMSLAAGYNVKMSASSYVNVSFMGSFIQQTLNNSNLSFDQQYVTGSYSASNPNNESFLNNKISIANFSAGAIWYCAPVTINLGKERTVRAYLGTSAFNLVNASSNESISGGLARVPIRFSMQGGIKITGAKFDVTPNVYSNSQSGNNNIAGGLLVDYHVNETSKLSMGAWYRLKDAVAFSVGYSISNFRLMYSYDVMSMSPISNVSSGLQTHEITLVITFHTAKKKIKDVIPSFF